MLPAGWQVCGCGWVGLARPKADGVNPVPEGKHQSLNFVGWPSKFKSSPFRLHATLTLIPHPVHPKPPTAFRPSVR